MSTDETATNTENIQEKQPETSPETAATTSESAESGTADNVSSEEAVAHSKKLEQLSLRTSAENKDFFNGVLRNLKKENPDATQHNAFSEILKLASLALQIPGLEKEIEQLRARKPEVKVEQVTVEKAVPIPLEPNQAIIGFSPELMKMIRQCRPYLKKKGLLSFETPEEYIGELTTTSIRKYLQLQCDHIINRL